MRPDAARILTDVALLMGGLLESLDRRLEVDVRVGADDSANDALVEVLAAMRGAEVREVVYVQGDEARILRVVEVWIGRVRLHATSRLRQATSLEVEAAGAWNEHVSEEFRSGTIRRPS